MANTPGTPGTAGTATEGEASKLLEVALAAGNTILNSAKALEGSLQQVLDLKLAALVESLGVDATSKAFEAYRTKGVRRQEELDIATVQTSAALERITGLNAIARKEMQAEADAALQGQSLLSIGSKNMYDAVKAYRGATITLLDGTSQASLALFKDVDGLFKTFTESIADDTRLQAFAMQGLTYDLAETMALANENLNISTATMNDIFQRELSETGKISGEYLKEYEKSLVATMQLTGVSADLIGKDLARMTSDFGHFGMMGQNEMMSLSVNLKKLGLDISDVTRLSDNFSSFDKAAATMSNLAASTGATLDTLELFKLANTDQEAFISSLRDQLESQGVEFENLNFIQQKQIASSFGIDPRILQRLLSDNFEAIDSIADEIGQKKAGISDETLRSTVAGLGSLRDEFEKVDVTEYTMMMASLGNATEETAIALERSYRTAVQFATAGVQKLSDGVSALVAKANEQRVLLLQTGYQGISEFTNDPKTKEVYANLGKTAEKGILAAGPEIYEAGKHTGKVLVEGFKWGSSYLTEVHSPSEAGNDMIKGITEGLKELEKSKIASTTGEKLSKQMQTALSESKSELAAVFKEFQDIMEIQAAQGESPLDRLRERFAGILTDDQIKAILEGRGSEVTKAIIDSKLDQKIADTTKKAEATPEESASAAKKAAAASTRPAEEKQLNIKITLAGGDELTELLAKSIITAGLKGISVGGDLIHLASVEPYEGRTLS